jgi:hypothetical protein
MTLTIAFAAIAAVALLVYASLAAPATSAIGIGLLFAIRQATVLIRVAARIGLLGAEQQLWRALMPPPPPEPAAIVLPDPPSAAPDVIEAPI